MALKLIAFGAFSNLLNSHEDQSSTAVIKPLKNRSCLKFKAFHSWRDYKPNSFLKILITKKI
jgi:hypothetical protein